MWTGGLTHWDTVLLLGFNSLARDPRLGALIEFISNSRLLTGTVFIAVYWYFWFDTGSRNSTEPPIAKLTMAATSAETGWMLKAAGF